MPGSLSKQRDAHAGSRRLDVAVAVIALIVLLPTSIIVLLEPQTGLDPLGAPALTTVIALVVLLHASAILAPRMPLVALPVASALMLGLALVPIGGGAVAALLPSSIAFLLCVGHAAAHSDIRVGLIALGVGVVGAGVITAATVTLGQPAESFLVLGEAVGLIALVATAWALGLLSRQRRRQDAAAEAARTREAIAEERTRISRDLHDVVAHAMTVMIAQSDAARMRVVDDPAAAAIAMDAVAETGRDALAGMRRAVRATEGAPLEPAPGIDDIVRLVEGANGDGRTATLEEHGERAHLDPAAMLALHHGIREALTNAMRHVAPPLSIAVSIDWGADAVRATIADDGGAGARDDQQGSGIGLIGLAERVRQAGGELEIDRGDGWTLRIALPAGRAA